MTLGRAPDFSPPGDKLNHVVDQTALDGVFGALSDPTRRAIVARLAAGETTLSELAAPFRMSLPAVSKHVRVLIAAGVVAQEKRGRTRYCRLEREPLQQAQGWISNYTEFWEGQLDALAAHVHGPAPDERR
jgi:DNA-binding transcriptional ArsR family regulator